MTNDNEIDRVEDEGSDELYSFHEGPSDEVYADRELPYDEGRQTVGAAHLDEFLRDVGQNYNWIQAGKGQLAFQKGNETVGVVVHDVDYEAGEADITVTYGIDGFQEAVSALEEQVDGDFESLDNVSGGYQTVVDRAPDRALQEREEKDGEVVEADPAKTGLGFVDGALERAGEVAERSETTG